MNNHSFSKKRGYRLNTRVILAVMAALFLRAALDLAYVGYVDRFFAYSLGAGIFTSTLNAVKLIISYLAVLLLSTCLAASMSPHPRPSGVIPILYFTVVMLPLSSLYGLTNAPGAFFYAAASSFMILIGVIRILPTLKVPRPDRTLVYLGLTGALGISAYVYSWLALTGGLERFTLDLLSVYETRTEYVARIGPFLEYFVPWQANVLNMLMLCWALHKKNLWLLFIAGIAQLLLSGMTGHKSFFLAPLLATGVYFIWPKRKALFYTFAGATVLVLGSYMVFLATGNHLFPSLLIRRLFFVPAANHFIYYHYFSHPENPFVMMSNSVLAPFIQYPYDTAVPIVIARAYWGRDFWPNVGYLGDAFAQFGFMGMFLFSMILGVLCRIIDSVGTRLPTNLVAAVAATPAMALTNSALFTSFLTHGLFLVVVSIWLFKRMLAKHTSLRKGRCFR